MNTGLSDCEVNFSASAFCRLWRQELQGGNSATVFLHGGEVAEGPRQRAGHPSNQRHWAIGHFLSEKLHPEMPLSLVILLRTSSGGGCLLHQHVLPTFQGGLHTASPPPSPWPGG